jgi:hypothetical protein
LRLYLKSNPSTPKELLAFNEENISQLSSEAGVFQLYDADRKVIAIQGTPNLGESLREALEKNEKAAWFNAEEDKMYSKRESLLVQQYLQEHGEMPGGGDADLDDLF